MSGHHAHSPHAHVAHAHPHAHASSHASPRQTPWRATLAVLIPAAVIVAVCMIWLWPGDQPTPDSTADGSIRVSGTVTLVDEDPCPEQPGDAGFPGPARCGTALVLVESGPDAGEEVFVDLPRGPGAPTVAEGDDVVLMYLPDTTHGEPYQLIDHERGTGLWMVVAAFALAVIAFGRWRGLTALAGLGVTFLVLLVFIVPAVLSGEPPLLVAIVGSAAIMLTVLYLTHGFSTSTSVAVVGTLLSLVITGLLSALAVSLTHLSGIADEETSYLGAVHGVNMQGLLLAGILIGALGVLDDVTVTQAATVAELARANPRYRFRDLYQAATRVGRSHIASVINTIVLAYAGASLPLLILVAASDRPLGEVVTNQLIAQEVVRSAIGTIGLIAAVPITTALAALAARRMPTAPAAGGAEASGEWWDDSADDWDGADRDVGDRGAAAGEAAAWEDGDSDDRYWREGDWDRGADAYGEDRLAALSRERDRDVWR